MTFSEIMREVGLSRATCHAVLVSLHEAGYVIRHGDRAYLLGPAVAAIGRSAEASFPYVPTIRHLVQDLVGETGHPCALTSVTEEWVIVLDHAGALAGPDHLRRGNRVPFVAPYGTVHAAWSHPRVRNTWLDGTGAPNAQLKRLLKEVQNRGFSVSPLDEARRHLRELLALIKKDVVSHDLRRLVERASGPVARDYLDEEISSGRRFPVSSVSCPVFDDAKHVAFGIHLEILEEDVSREDLLAYVRAIHHTAALATDAVRRQRS